MPRKTTPKTSTETADRSTVPTRQPRSSKAKPEPAPAKPVRKAARRTTVPRTRKSQAGQSAPTAPSISVAEPEPAAPQGTWRRIDLHMHTPGSADYEQSGVTYLDILQQAERRGLDIIAFTDHNTVNGFRHMQREIADLELLERLNRISPDELGRLAEYRRLLRKILVLPGFEFTGTFGFHILGVFPPEKRLRDIEYLLVQMHVPGDALDQGLTEAGATSDVLTSYRLIDEAGGLAIAAHANSSSGVLMRGISIGGQTRIAFTQDTHLAAVELTDLNKGRRSMAYWLSGIKAEYPRKMHIIQGSDAHRLTTSTLEARRLGVGDRTTEVLLPETDFAALRSLFLSQDFHRVRPARAPLNIAVEPVKDVRTEEPGATRSFHPALPKRGNRFDAVLFDVCAMANGEGGAIVVGCEPGLTKKPAGVASAQDVTHKLSEAIQEHLTPPVPAIVKAQALGEVDVVLVTVPKSDQAPHAIDENQFYVRVDTETRRATRDEILAITRRALEAEAAKAAQANRHRGGQAQRHEPQQKPQPVQPQQRQPQNQQPRGQQPQRPPQSQPQQQSRQPHSGQQQRQAQNQGSQPVPSQPQTVQPTANGGRPALPQTQPAIAPATPSPQAVDTHAAANGGVDQASPTTPVVQPSPAQNPVQPQNAPQQLPLIEGMPRSGVQIAAVEERDGIRHYTVRDLRNNILVRNVTLKSARDLWHYAIVQYNTNAYKADDVRWPDNPDEPLQRVILGKAHRAGKMRYDLALRGRDGTAYIFYGVSEDGMDSTWRQLLAQEQAAEQASAAQAATTETLIEPNPV